MTKLFGRANCLYPLLPCNLASPLPFSWISLMSPGLPIIKSDDLFPISLSLSLLPTALVLLACSFLWNSILGFCFSLSPGFPPKLLLMYIGSLSDFVLLIVAGRIGHPQPHFSSYYISFLLRPPSFRLLQAPSPCYGLSSLYHQLWPHPWVPHLHAQKLSKFLCLCVPWIEYVQIQSIQYLNQCQFLKFVLSLVFSIYYLLRYLSKKSNVYSSLPISPPYPASHWILSILKVDFHYPQ